MSTPLLTVAQMIEIIVKKDCLGLSKEKSDDSRIRLRDTYSYDRIIERSRACATPEEKARLPEAWLNAKNLEHE